MLHVAGVVREQGTPAPATEALLRLRMEQVGQSPCSGRAAPVRIGSPAGNATSGLVQAEEQARSLMKAGSDAAGDLMRAYSTLI